MGWIKRTIIWITGDVPDLALSDMRRWLFERSDLGILFEDGLYCVEWVPAMDEHCPIRVRHRELRTAVRMGLAAWRAAGAIPDRGL